MIEPTQDSAQDDYSVLRAGAIVLALGFLTTASGSIWTILSPVGGGVNFGAGLLYEGGMLVGVIGLVLTIVGLLGTRKAARDH